ncbi:hypothetical protein CA85_13400 [Allorhodopirellula solitaria]|uniref:Uncharacterized protein n=1 Tax=Allorhodopirellula solitaria TaxID=2527987 RepID=A0A5C5YD63_9BACT|nr:hypothetical protein CA85_13400 [Allorhodopirellula solitaria]
MPPEWPPYEEVVPFLSDSDSTIDFTFPAELGGAEDEPFASLPGRASMHQIGAADGLLAELGLWQSLSCRVFRPEADTSPASCQLPTSIPLGIRENSRRSAQRHLRWFVGHRPSTPKWVADLVVDVLQPASGLARVLRGVSGGIR